MCGRISLSTPARVVAEHFGLAEVPELAPRWNVAPGQPVAIVRVRHTSGERALELCRWGLVPPWSKDASGGARLVNAREETVAERPAFRRAFRERRCLVPADGFYEWQTRGQRFRQPYRVQPVGGALFAIAGLYERWEGGEGERVDSCTLLTTRANETIARLHDRMPVILPREAWAAWLDPGLLDPVRLRALLAANVPDALELHPVGLRVNDPRHDDPECARPAPEIAPELF
ncbi:MAG TPA: SOS response-associated peptidase [Myxococcota bacterium]|nr:SOS response-associated peptidase [Myxococcota bacterium]